MGDKYLLKLLVVGATSLVRRSRHKPETVDPRLVDLLARKVVRVATIALANKMARIATRLRAKCDGRHPISWRTRPRPASLTCGHKPDGSRDVEESWLGHLTVNCGTPFVASAFTMVTQSPPMSVAATRKGRFWAGAEDNGINFYPMTLPLIVGSALQRRRLYRLRRGPRGAEPQPLRGALFRCLHRQSARRPDAHHYDSPDVFSDRVWQKYSRYRLHLPGRLPPRANAP